MSNTLFTIPADGQEYWQIGDHVFTPLGDINLYIEDNGVLYVQADAQAPDAINQAQSDLISNYGDKKVYLRFNFRGIYNADIPTGAFRLEKENAPLCSFWKGGFQISQRLTAEVTLKEGWLGIHGHLGTYPIRAAFRLPLNKIDWKKYSFQSTEEVSTARPDIVYKLQLTTPDPAALEQALHPLKNLETLLIYYPPNSTQANGFTQIPEAIKHLTALKSLSITGVPALTSVPEWLGQLKQLESFTLHGSSVTAIPDGGLQLPVLKKLYLRNNKLESIPAALPESLEMLILSHNQLTLIPASALRLQQLDIENNPLQQLPEGLENIPKLNLELDKKLSLLDYSYKGADGLGTIAYDDKLFYDPPSTVALTSVALATTEEDSYSEKGHHRFGGLPDLPGDIPYPTFTAYDGQEMKVLFIAQLNCAAIAHLQEYLPRTGMLYFFLDNLDETNARVLYSDSSGLRSAKDLEDLIFDEDDLYTPFRAEAGKYTSLPHDSSEESIRPAHSVNSYVFKQYGTPEREAAAIKRGKPEEWMVLLQVSSDGNTGFNFWDAGVVYFVIHKSDLAKKDFSNVYCGLESS